MTREPAYNAGTMDKGDRNTIPDNRLNEAANIQENGRKFAYINIKMILYLRHSTLKGNPSKVRSRPAGHTQKRADIF